MRPGTYALIISSLAAAAFVGAMLHGAVQGRRLASDLALASDLVRELRLTDLALFTEARYTRHPTQADLHSPFQDHPLALEHFPTGTLLGPPPHLTSHAPLAQPATLSD